MIDRDTAVMVDPRNIFGVNNHCPACFGRINTMDNFRPKYCPHCGQLLNWRVCRSLDTIHLYRCTFEDNNLRCRYYHKICKGSKGCGYVISELPEHYEGHCTKKERENDIRVVLNSFDWEEQKQNIDYVQAERRTKVEVE